MLIDIQCLCNRDDCNDGDIGTEVFGCFEVTERKAPRGTRSIYIYEHDPWFSDLIKPHRDIQKSTSLTISNLASVNLTATFPDSSRLMPNLCKLNIYVDVGHQLPRYVSLFNVRTLTKFSFTDYKLSLPLSTVLDFLEKNESLNHIKLVICFMGKFPSLKYTHPIKDQIQHLSIRCDQVEYIQALVSCIPLQKGGLPKIRNWECGKGFREILPNIHRMPFTNLLSPTYMYYNEEYEGLSIQLSASDGDFHFCGFSQSEIEPHRAASTLLQRNLKAPPQDI